jgi:hypothetical protein
VGAVDSVQVEGAVLKAAVVQVHSVVATSASTVTETTEQESESRENRTPRECYQLDVTVTPNPVPGKFTHWVR